MNDQQQYSADGCGAATMTRTAAIEAHRKKQQQQNRNNKGEEQLFSKPYVDWNRVFLLVFGDPAALPFGATSLTVARFSTVRRPNAYNGERARDQSAILWLLMRRLYFGARPARLQRVSWTQPTNESVATFLPHGVGTRKREANHATEE